jgi:hypothetical protein
VRLLLLTVVLLYADCSGDPGAEGAINFGGTDAPDLGSQEFVVVVFDFGLNNDAGGFRATAAGAAAGSSLSANVSGGFNPGVHAVAGVSAVTTDNIANFRFVLRSRMCVLCSTARDSRGAPSPCVW